MFPHKITIHSRKFDKIKREDIIVSQQIEGVLIDYTTKLINIKNGVESKVNASIIIPNVNYKIEVGDLISLDGILEKAFTVIAVNVIKNGSPLDHIEILV